MTEEERFTFHREISDGALVLELAGVSDRGPVRSENEDAWNILSLHPHPGCALLLADGMGGHEAGATAAQAAVEVAGKFLRNTDDPHAALPRAVAEANEAVGRERTAIGAQVMGTTLVAAVVSDGRASIANVGDSRAYIVRSHSAAQVTDDHSWVAEEVRAGRLNPEEASGNPRRALLTRALIGDKVDADTFVTPLQDGDVLLLCSDGLWEPVDEERLGEILAVSGPLEDLLVQVCDAALEMGSTDNVTAVACRACGSGS